MSDIEKSTSLSNIISAHKTPDEGFALLHVFRALTVLRHAGLIKHKLCNTMDDTLEKISCCFSQIQRFVIGGRTHGYE